MASKQVAAVARGARRRELTRTAILDATERVMTTEAETFRIDDVAVAAGVSPASIYTHFGTKEGLMAAVAERLLTVAEESILSAVAAPGRPLDRVTLVGLAFMETLVAHPPLGRYLTVGASREPTSSAEAQVGIRIGRARRAFEDTIAAAVESGEMVQQDPRLLSYALLGAWTGIAALQTRRDDLHLSSDDTRAALRTFSKTILAGFSAPGKVTP